MDYKSTKIPRYSITWNLLSLGIALNKDIPKNRSFWSLGHFRAFLFYVAIVAVLFGGHAGNGMDQN